MNPYTIPGIIRTDKTESIIELVCNCIGITKEDVFKRNRSYRIVLARQLIYYFLRRRTAMTLKEIGIFFSQDHSTIIHGLKSIQDYLDTDHEYVTDCVRNIENTILIAA